MSFVSVIMLKAIPQFYQSSVVKLKKIISSIPLLFQQCSGITSSTQDEVDALFAESSLPTGKYTDFIADSNSLNGDNQDIPGIGQAFGGRLDNAGIITVRLDIRA